MAGPSCRRLRERPREAEGSKICAGSIVLTIIYLPRSFALTPVHDAPISIHGEELAAFPVRAGLIAASTTCSLTTIMSQDWQTRCAERKAKQLALIPQEWRITVPPEEQRNVQDIPKTCGLLTSRELEITETTDVDVLLSNLATGAWSSVEVTTAFYKRAIIAQQLVSSA